MYRDNRAYEVLRVVRLRESCRYPGSCAAVATRFGEKSFICQPTTTTDVYELGEAAGKTINLRCPGRQVIFRIRLEKSDDVRTKCANVPCTPRRTCYECA